MSLSRTIGWASVAIIAASVYLSLHGLGDNYFWDDEAGTAIFARNLLRSGKLTAWDGRNLMAYRDGVELDRAFINRYVPPLQFCLCAASFRFLGESTFAGRFPFVLAGLAALAVFSFLLSREASEARGLGLAALALLAFSPSFLLYLRQCRYFSLVILFPLIAYWGYTIFIRRGRSAGLILAALGFLGLFFSHYLACLCFAFALLGLHVRYYLRGRRLWPFLLAGGVCLGIAAAYIFLYKVVFPPFPKVSGERWFLDRGALFLRNLRELNAYSFFPWMALLPLLWMMLDKRFDPRLKRLGREWLLLCLLFVVCASLFSPQPVVPQGDADIRYLIALLPFLAGLLGLVAYFLWGKCRIVSSVFVLVLIFTNLLTLNPWLPLPLRFDLVSYLREIHSDYTTAYEAAVGFIRKNCRKDDVIVVVPPNMNFPLQFYVGGKVVFGGVVDRWTNLDREKVRSLNPSLLFEEVEPDWIVSFGLRDMTFSLLNHFAARGVLFSPPRVIEVYYLGEQIRPEILLHSFGPVTKFDPEKEGVLFFKRSGGGKR